jgi:addiction module HigA family antidote
MKTKLLEENPMERVEKLLQLEGIHPGQLMVKYFMRPRDITADRLANDTGVPLEHINEIIAGKRAITPEIAKLCERCFGWPARVLLDWQNLYDVEVELWGQETWLADAIMHVRAQEMFLAHVKDNIKTLKGYGAFVKRRLPARLRPAMRRIHGAHASEVLRR